MVEWLANKVGDKELAYAVSKAFERNSDKGAATDAVRIVTFVRLSQCNEVLEDAERDCGT